VYAGCQLKLSALKELRLCFILELPEHAILHWSQGHCCRVFQS